ncbi:hypothetical protein [Galactobacter caseinivorans]|uniref:Uncharacterized protein n=1 Tax=Galactobacter caseinivorans TaxID=2676123 RepID=A0A496PHY4_9MICC|nr:hypothetical protein [Galactobacter caseinivorans]RKW70085.1 hypothetical protein DWQ67_08970 [Galactobacter caseinivorans]
MSYSSKPKPPPLSPRNSRLALVTGWTLAAAALGSLGVGLAQNAAPQQEVRFQVEQGLPYGVTQASVEAAMAKSPVRSREPLEIRVARGPMPDAQRYGRVPISADAFVTLDAPTDRIGALSSSAPSRGNAVSALQDTDGRAPSVSELSRELDRVLSQNLDTGNGPTAVVQVARALAEGQPGRAWQEPGGWLLVAVGLGSAGGTSLLMGWPRRMSGSSRRMPGSLRRNGSGVTARIDSTLSPGSSGAVGARSTEQKGQVAQDPATDLAPLLEELCFRWERLPRGIPGMDQDRLGADLKRLRRAGTAVESWATEVRAGNQRAGNQRAGSQRVSEQQPALPAATVRKVELAIEPLRQRLKTLRDQLGTEGISTSGPTGGSTSGSADRPKDGTSTDDPARRLLASAAGLAAQTRGLLGDGPAAATPAASGTGNPAPSRKGNPAPSRRGNPAASRRGNPAASGRGSAVSRSAASRPAKPLRGERVVRWSLQSLVAAAVGAVAVIPAILVGYGAEPPESAGDQRVERVSIQGDGLPLDQDDVLRVLDEARFPRPQHLVIRVDPAPELVKRAVADSGKDGPEAGGASSRSGREYFVPTSLLPTQTALLRTASPELFDPQTGQLTGDTTVVGLWRLPDGRLATNMTLTSVAAGTQTASMPGVGSSRDFGLVVDPSNVDSMLGRLETSWPEAAARESLTHPAVSADATGWVVFGSATVLSLGFMRRQYPDRTAKEL